MTHNPGEPKPIIYNNIHFKSQRALAKYLGIDPTLISRRLKNNQPLEADHDKNKITINNVTYKSKYEAAKKLHISKQGLDYQLNKFGTNDPRIGTVHQNLKNPKYSSTKLTQTTIDKIKKLLSQPNAKTQAYAGKSMIIRSAIHELYTNLTTKTITKTEIMVNYYPTQSKQKSKLITVSYNFDEQTRSEINDLKSMLNISQTKDIITTCINYAYQKHTTNSTQLDKNKLSNKIIISANKIAYDLTHTHNKRQLNNEIDQLIHLLSCSKE